MRLRAKYSLMTASLVVAVVVAASVAIMSGEKRFLEAQSAERVEALAQGVARIAQESVDSEDRFMLLTYLTWLQKAHPELALAEVTRAGHEAVIGKEGVGLSYWETLVKPRAGLVGPSASIGTQTVSVRLGFSRARLDAEVAEAERRMAARTSFVGAVFVGLGVLGALALGGWLTASLTELMTAVESIGDGRLDVAVSARGNDEVGSLSRRFNQMAERLRDLNQFREDVLHTLTHELNTPLAGLKGYLELWSQETQPRDLESRRQALEMMSRAVDRMGAALGSALQLFKNGSTEVSPRRIVWLDDMFREIYTLLEPTARSKGVCLMPLPEPTGEFLYTDEELLRQILSNLLSNAIKYTPSGGEVRLELACDEREVRLRVADTGYGIAPQDLKHLFTKFYRAGEGRDGSRRIPGTGLGLSIAEKAARALGGTIAVESQLQQGTVFTVALPKPKPKPKPKAQERN